MIPKSRALRWFALLALFTLGQLAIVFLAFSVGLMWVLYPLWLGLQTMRFLPADPQTAGSFIVFPTLAQIALAIGVNDLTYAAVWYGVRRLRRRLILFSPCLCASVVSFDLRLIRK